MKTTILFNVMSLAFLSVATSMSALACEQQETVAGASGADRDFEGKAFPSIPVDLPAGEISYALDVLSSQSGVDLRYQAEGVEGKRARAVSGQMSWRDALDQLLQGSGLNYRQVDDTTVLIERREGRVTAEDGGAGIRPQPASSRTASGATDIAPIMVTGTRIRGGTTPSPVITIGSEQIREEGFADLGEVIRSVPQNFGGGQNPGVAVGATSGGGGLANQNITGGSSLNLRGLGPDATLTLLNGRRMAYGGIAQAVDINAIPVEAVERIDIVPDGASAIYGSDAVGGVGNVILKRDYEGVTVDARYGGATEGGLVTHEYTATAGTTWSSGGLIATYKNVSSDPIYARQRRYTAQMFDPTTLYPGVELRSALVSGHQSIGDSAELRLDALKTWRDQDLYPWNTGLVPYYYRTTPKTATILISPSLELALAGGWTLSIGAGQGKDTHVQRQSQVDIATGASTTLIRECYCNESLSYEIGAEGPLFATAGGEARIALGAGGRKNEFAQNNDLTGARLIEGNESSRFAYVEINLPLIGSNSGVTGVRRLDATAAVRGEDYDSFGSVTTPKLGLIYAPSTDFTLKASWGKSFKAPTLFQRYQAKAAVLDSAMFYGGSGPDATVLSLFGGSTDLDAERATTRAISVTFHPQALPAFESELTLFDIDYTDRVVQPITDYGQALVNPNYAQFINHAPTGESLAAVIASADAFYNYVGRTYDPGDVVAIMYAQYVNVARQRAKGFDLSGSYWFDLGAGRLAIRGSASWLDSSQQNSAAQATYDIAGTIFNPAKVHGRWGAVWNQGGFVASAFTNYVSGVTDVTANRRSGSFTTFDVALRYATDQPSGVLSGLEFALSMQNALNRAPPSYEAAAPDRPPYDSTNYSAIGRFITLSVSKHW